MVRLAELGRGAWGGPGPERLWQAQAMAEADLRPPDVPGAGATLRRVPGLGLAVLPADRLRAPDAVAERRPHEGAGPALGLDTRTPEGLGAAEANHEARRATEGTWFSR